MNPFLRNSNSYFVHAIPNEYVVRTMSASEKYAASFKNEWYELGPVDASGLQEKCNRINYVCTQKCH